MNIVELKLFSQELVETKTELKGVSMRLLFIRWSQTQLQVNASVAVCAGCVNRQLFAEIVKVVFTGALTPSGQTKCIFKHLQLHGY